MTDEDGRIRTSVSGTDLSVARATLSDAYAGIAWHADTTAQDFSFRFAVSGDAAMTLRAVRFDGHLDGEMPPSDDVVVQWLTAGRGAFEFGQEEFQLQIGRPRVWPQGAFRFRFDDYDQRLVQVNREALEVVAAERGVPARALRFPHEAAPSDEALRMWRNSVALISRTVLDQAASPLLQAEMGRLGALALLELHPQTIDLPGEVLLPRNAHLRQAVEYLHDHVHLPITSADLAREANLSIRGLQQAFQREFGLTPNGFIRAVRLDRIRAELVAGPPGALSVAEVARRWGFGHAGRFSAAYATRFGEYPSDTARR
jgi:AraC-like DNA-binding protein